MNTQRQLPPKRTKEQIFKLTLDQFLKGLTKYEYRQGLDQFENGIGNYLLF